MRAGNRPEDADQHHQGCTGCKRIAQQRNGCITRRQPLGHDAGADHDSDEQRRAQRLGREALPNPDAGRPAHVFTS
jgi:hypothetical protein